MFSSSVFEMTETVLLHLHIRPHAFRNFRLILASLHLRFNSINERITQLTDRAIINESIMGFFIAVPKPTSLLHPPMNKYFIILGQFIIFTNRDNQAQAKCVKHKTHFLRSLIFNQERCFQFKHLMRYKVLTACIAYSDLLNSENKLNSKFGKKEQGERCHTTSNRLCIIEKPSFLLPS